MIAVNSDIDIDDDNLSPGMKQYMSVKTKHPDCIVFFRMGDFYETFYQDAKTIAKELDITLTSRGKGERKAPLAGIPYHAVQPYVGKLITKGYKVCIVEQVEDPKKAKGLVKRDVVRIITPGTVIEDTLLTNSKNNYILAINKNKNNISCAVCDISTGEFFVTSCTYDRMQSELERLSPAEIIYPMSLENSEFSRQLKGWYCASYDDLYFFKDKAQELINTQFANQKTSVITLLDSLQISCGGALLSYLEQAQKSKLQHISFLKIVTLDDYMMLDRVSLSNLNIISDNKDNKPTLYSTINKTVTSMGARLLRNWVVKPLKKISDIKQRHNAVEELVKNTMLSEELCSQLNELNDFDRILSRISMRNASPKDVLALGQSLEKIPLIQKTLSLVSSELLAIPLPQFPHIVEKLNGTLVDDPPTSVREGHIIRDGYSKELDELRIIKRDSKQWLLSFEESEKKRTGIKFLKISYNKVFGYFIEISNSNLSLVPPEYIRKQTQVNGERFITPELKEKENIILTVDEKIAQLEYELFMKLLDEIDPHTAEIQQLSQLVAQLDCLQSFAKIAVLQRYVKPIMHEKYTLHIVKGRHPIVEILESRFIANDLTLDEDSKLIILSGPNMAGKSVYIKQNALIVLMAHIGSFVPAESAIISIVDAIFSRVGASDDIASGHSTFMVEMNETANILQRATDTSLIILDEIGRGTSTYDGVSLAWSIAEYLVRKVRAKTLFATHYHHLNRLSDIHDDVQNYHISVAEKNDDIVFLRTVVSGGTDRSYGIHVAKLAGLPTEVITNAKKVITQFEIDDEIGKKLHSSLKPEKPPTQKPVVVDERDKLLTGGLVKKKLSDKEQFDKSQKTLINL